MNIKGVIEKGKHSIREEGVNFQGFKEQLQDCFIHPLDFTEDEWVEQYNDYAFMRGKLPNEPMSVKEWAYGTFNLWTISECQNALKPY